MTDQEIRLKFGEMNAGEMRLARALVAWHEREIAKLKEGLAEAQQIAESWSKHIHPATHDYTDEEIIQAAKRAHEYPRNGSSFFLRNYLAELPARPQAAEIAKLKAEREELDTKLTEVVEAAERAGWNGVENSKHLPTFIANLAEDLSKAKAELAAMPKPILADDAFDVARVKRQLPMKECCDSGFKAVAAVVLAQAVRRMEEVPKEEIWKVYKDDPHPFAQEALEAVRERLIAAAKGEGHVTINGLEGLTKERCLRIAEIEGDSTIAAGRPDVCPHAAPHVFCETCKASPCPIGIPAKGEGQAQEVPQVKPASDATRASLIEHLNKPSTRIEITEIPDTPSGPAGTLAYAQPPVVVNEPPQAEEPAWIPHDGGPCPLKDEQVGMWEVKWPGGFGATLKVKKPSNFLSWGHKDLFYRVLKWKPGFGPEAKAEEPATFQAHGKTWTRHTPGDPMPCDGEAMVNWLLREELDGNWEYRNLSTCAEDLDWQAAVGWRYAEEPAQAQQAEAQLTGTQPVNLDEAWMQARPWTPAVGDTVRLKSGGPVMTVHYIAKDGSMGCIHNANGHFEFTTVPAACLTQAQP